MYDTSVAIIFVIMFVNDLKENNYVFYQLESGERISFAILAIHNNSVDLYRNDERIYRVPLDRIYPIPLDQNWLNLFGYEPHPRVLDYQWVPKYTAGFMKEGRFYIDHHNGYVFIVDYVHHLQNTVAFLLRRNYFGPKGLKNPPIFPNL